MSALETMHGFDLTYDYGRPNIVRHGPGERYVHADQVIVEQLDRWLMSCRRYDADPRGDWRR